MYFVFVFDHLRNHNNRQQQQKQQQQQQQHLQKKYNIDASCLELLCFWSIQGTIATKKSRSGFNNINYK